MNVDFGTNPIFLELLVFFFFFVGGGTGADGADGAEGANMVLITDVGDGPSRLIRGG